MPEDVRAALRRAQRDIEAKLDELPEVDFDAQEQRARELYSGAELTKQLLGIANSRFHDETIRQQNHVYRMLLHLAERVDAVEDRIGRG